MASTAEWMAAGDVRKTPSRYKKLEGPDVTGWPNVPKLRLLDACEPSKRYDPKIQPHSRLGDTF